MKDEIGTNKRRLTPEKVFAVDSKRDQEVAYQYFCNEGICLTFVDLSLFVVKTQDK